MKNNKPKIRFKDFTGPWEQRKLRELVDVCNGRDYKHLKEGTIPVYGTGGYMLSVNEALSYDKDAIGIGRKGTIDKPYILYAPFWTVDTLFYAIPAEKFDLNFAFDIFQNIDWKMKDESTGVPSLSKTAINNIDIFIPKYYEQQFIGRLFSNLDNLITLHQRKCDNLKKIKKAMLEKMFPKNGNSVPDVRFKGFTDDWEQRKLRDIVGIYDGVHQTPKYQDGGIMFLSVENIATLHSSKYISEEDFKRDYKVYPQENDILMTRIGDVGTTNVVTDNGLKAYYVSLALLKYRSTNPFFLSNAIQSDYVQNGLANRTLKTAIPMKINKDEIGKVDVMLPTSTDEQVQIGTYFRNLDNLITLHQRKVENLKKIKKAMLEKMFPKEDLI